MSIWKKAPVHRSVSVVNRPRFMSAVEIEYDNPPYCIETLRSVSHGNCHRPWFCEPDMAADPGIAE